MGKRERKLVASVAGGVPDELRCRRSDVKAWRCSAAAIAGLSLCPKHHQRQSGLKRKTFSSDEGGKANKRAKTVSEEVSNLAEGIKKRKRKVKEEKNEAVEPDFVPPERNSMKRMRVIEEKEQEDPDYGARIMRLVMRITREEEEEPRVMKKFVPTGLMEIPLVIDGGRDVVPDELPCKRSDGKQWSCGARAMPERFYSEKHYIQLIKRQGGSTKTHKMKKDHKEVTSNLHKQKEGVKISGNPPQQEEVEKKQRNFMKRKMKDEEVDVRNYDSEDSQIRVEDDHNYNSTMRNKKLEWKVVHLVSKLSDEHKAAVDVPREVDTNLPKLRTNEANRTDVRKSRNKGIMVSLYRKMLVVLSSCLSLTLMYCQCIVNSSSMCTIF